MERTPSLVRYLRVAACLPEKSVRDVALRIRWMSRKDKVEREKEAPRKPRLKVRPAGRAGGRWGRGGDLVALR